MLDSGLAKAIRWILFIPAIQLTLWLLNYGILYITVQLVITTWSFWKTLFFISILGSAIFYLPIMISTLFSFLTVLICPDQKTGGYIYSIFAVLNYIYLLYKIWTFDTVFSTSDYISITVVSIIIIVTMLSSISAALSFNENE
jgi:hypothetical protein